MSKHIVWQGNISTDPFQSVCITLPVNSCENHFISLLGPQSVLNGIWTDITYKWIGFCRCNCSNIKRASCFTAASFSFMWKRSSSINPPTDWTGWELQQGGDGRQPCKACSVVCPLDSLMLPLCVCVCVRSASMVSGGRVSLSFITTEQLGLLFTMATVAVKTRRAKTSRSWNNDCAWE